MPAHLAEETVAPDEAATIAEFIAFLQESSARRPRPPGAPIGRFNQTRAAGCVDAEFAVPADLPPSLQVGLFARASIRRAYASPTPRRPRTVTPTSEACP
jgi:hypothetical protein